MAAPHRAGFVAILGRPNVGKSTLLNHVLGQKIAIATSRPQTTRNRILGVRNVPGAQLVLIDTPGLHRPSGKGRSRLNQFMVREALDVMRDVDVILVLAECPIGADLKKMGGRPQIDVGTKYILEELATTKKPAVLALNKVDMLGKKSLMLPLLTAYTQAYPFAAVVPISAKTGDGVDRLLEALVPMLPEGAAIYPEEMVTDRAERFLAAELIRERVFVLTKQEIPYSVAVSIDTWQERAANRDKPADLVIEATIHVEKEAQKKIVVGARGAMVREIGSTARREISNLVDCPVHLKLFVRVDEGWTGSERQLRDLGYSDES